jgi:hypothetical protein
VQYEHHHHISSSISQSSTLITHIYFGYSNFTDATLPSTHQNQPIKMQFTTVLASTIIALASGISAVPTPAPNVTIRVFNDVTGINSDATVPADNVPRPITTLFEGTAIGNAGFIGTSAQLTQFSDSTKCTLANSNIPGWTIQLDGRSKNFVDLDGDVTKPIPTWIGGFTFQCTQ